MEIEIAQIQGILLPNYDEFNHTLIFRPRIGEDSFSGV